MMRKPSVHTDASWCEGFRKRVCAEEIHCVLCKREPVVFYNWRDVSLHSMTIHKKSAADIKCSIVHILAHHESIPLGDIKVDYVKPHENNARFIC